MTYPFTHRSYTIMTTRATAQNIVMINPQDRIKLTGRVAGLTAVAAQYMGNALANRSDTIMATNTITVNRRMVKHNR